jgi:hypothetical protein
MATDDDLRGVIEDAYDAIRAEKTQAAADALAQLVQVLPDGDTLKHPCHMLGFTVAGRVQTGMV